MENHTHTRFDFCGGVVISKKNPLVKRETFGGVNKISINFGIKNGSNCVYVTAQAFKNKTIKTKDVNNNNYDVDWEDRFDEDIVSNVSGMRKYVVNLGERKEFITSWDMIEYLESALPGYADDICVNGRFVRRPGTGSFKDRFFDEFQILNVYAAAAEDKRQFRLGLDLYYNKESLDKSNVKDNGKIYLNAYIPLWSREDGKNRMFPISLIFNTAAYDMSKEKHKALYNFKMKCLETKQKNPVHMFWSLAIVNGAEEKEFDESCLTEMQKMAIEVGMKTLDDFRPNGNIYGERIREYRLFEPVFEGDFTDGPIDSGFTLSEFENQIYNPNPDETIDDMMESAKKNGSSKISAPFDVDEDDEDLI